MPSIYPCRPVLKGSLRELNEKISGNVPIYFMTGEYDFACTPQMTEETAKKVKGSETIIMEGIGHFPMCENPELYKEYLMPVLEEILAAERELAKAGVEVGGR